MDCSDVVHCSEIVDFSEIGEIIHCSEIIHFSDISKIVHCCEILHCSEIGEIVHCREHLAVVAFRPLLGANFSENLLNVFLLHILSVPAIVLHMASIAPEVRQVSLQQSEKQL